MGRSAAAFPMPYQRDHHHPRRGHPQPRPSDSPPVRPAEPRAAPQRITNPPQVGDFHHLAAETANDLTARCQPVNIDRRSTFGTGERLLHGGTAPARSAPGIQARPAPTTSVGRSAKSVRRSQTTSATRSANLFHDRTAADSWGAAFSGAVIAAYSIAGAMQWFMSQESTSPSMAALSRWVEGYD
jgi:hypothetical protein